MLSRVLAPMIVTLALVLPALAEVSARFFPAAFGALDDSQRRAVQHELQTAGFYGGAIDGRYGSGTEKALLQAVEHMQENSYGLVVLLDTEADAVSFLFALAEGSYAKWLYGEGDESDGG
jgi:hypothetical protein